MEDFKNKPIKIFRNMETGEIRRATYTDAEDYYPLIKSCMLEGYGQVIITNDMMIQIAEEFVVVENLNISQIQLDEYHKNLEYNFNTILHSTDNNHLTMESVINILRDLLNNTTENIDIYSIFIQGYDESGEYIRIIVNANGVVDVKAHNSFKIQVQVTEIIARIFSCKFMVTE